MKKLLLLGGTGKFGTAVRRAFAQGYEIKALASKDFDAHQPEQLLPFLEELRPDVIINGVAYMGIDPSEEAPQAAFALNTLLPRFLAQQANHFGALLVHLSTDAVFSGKQRCPLTEESLPDPVNLYGSTKLAGDHAVAAIAERYYLLRVSLLFGETEKNSQFVEKMLERVKGGAKELRIADDIVLSPSYAFDIANCLRRMLEAELSSGLYHVANAGEASLHELMVEVCRQLALDVNVLPVSQNCFPGVGIKNDFTPLKSIKLEALRPWKEAVAAYVAKLKDAPV